MNSTIYTNMDSVRNYNIFNTNSSNASKAMERATTGLKIASAKDNASQYAVSEKMLERINANNQAAQNVQTDNALTRTASGALANTIDILKSLKAKAIDAANDSNTDADRATIQKDVDQLIAQINTNANTAKFNGKALLDGSHDEKVSNSTKTAYTIDASTGIRNKTAKDFVGISNTETAQLIVSWADANGKVTTNDTVTGVTSGMKFTDILSGTSNSVNVLSATIGATLKYVAANGDITTDKNNLAIKATGDVVAAVANDGGTAKRFSGLTVKLVSNVDPSKSVSFSFDDLVQRGKDQKTTDDTLSFQIGESSGMSINLAIADMSAGASGLGINGISVKTKDDAKGTIGVLDNAITYALQQQTSIGAMEERLGFTADTLDTMNENLQASNSAIRDANMAKEISDYMKWNVLMQSSQYMLAQSNQNAFSVLNLLQ